MTLRNGNLSELIYTRRRNLRMSRADLAEQMTLNGYECTESAINHWENSRAVPPIEDTNFVRALAVSLNLAPSEIARASGILSISAELTEEVLARLSPGTLQLLKEASPNSIKKVEAIIRTMLTEEEQ